MKYLRQFGIILGISFVGELLRYFIPLHIPASIYGLVLLFLILQFRIIEVESIRETSRFLIEIMPILFVPAGVGLLSSWGVLQPVWLPILVIVITSTIIVMAVSGLVTQGIIHLDKKRHRNNTSEHVYIDESGTEKQYIKENDLD